MSSSNIVMTGRVVSEIKTEDRGTDYSLARFRLAVASRKFDRDMGRMTTTGMSYYTVVCWRTLARNVATAVKKGDAVVVAGRLRVRDWVDETGRGGTVAEVNATAIGHDLAAHGSDAA